MSASSVSFNSTKMKKTNRSSATKSVKTTIRNTNLNKNFHQNSSDDSSFASPKIRTSNSNFSQRKIFNSNQSLTNGNTKSLRISKSKQEIEKRNIKNNTRIFSDSDCSDIPIHLKQNRISYKSNNTHPTNNTARPITSNRINHRHIGNKSSVALMFSSSESSSDSLRIKKHSDNYEITKFKSNSNSEDKHKKYLNTIDTVIESDDSDDIPFLDSESTGPEIDFKPTQKTYLKNESNDSEKENIENQIEKDSKIELHQKPKSKQISNESKKLKSSKNIINKDKNEKLDNKEQIQIFQSSEKLNRNKNDGIIRTKYYGNNKYKITKKNKEIQISFSDSDLEEEENKNENEEKEDDRINQNKIQNLNGSPHSSSQNATENDSDELVTDNGDENYENNDLNQCDFEKGVTSKSEVKRLCSSFMKRRPGYKIPDDLIPYKMHTDSKMSFHGKKVKFTLFRGEVPLLSAKLKYKNGSDPIVFIFKYVKPERSTDTKKEKKKEKSKNKNKSKNLKKMTPIAVIITGSNFSTFSLRKSEIKSESTLYYGTNNDELSSIHNSYGFGFAKEIMTIRYSMPKVDYAPRIVDIYFFDPPSPIPNELANRKPKYTYGSTCILDIGGRIAKRSIKNCIMIDENDKDRLSIMKIKDSVITIEAYPTIGEISVFAFGISSVLCKL